MPCIWGSHDKRQILTKVALSALAPKATTFAQLLARNSPIIYTALLDTGATTSCVTEDVVNDLRLAQTGVQPVPVKAFNQQTSMLFEYLVNVSLVGSQPGPKGAGDVGQYSIAPAHRVLGFPALPAYQMIIGMDILREGTLFVSPDDFTFSF